MPCHFVIVHIVDHGTIHIENQSLDFFHRVCAMIESYEIQVMILIRLVVVIALINSNNDFDALISLYLSIASIIKLGENYVIST